jgi:Xaa-Pro aminopeptidase
MSRFDLTAIQSALREAGLDGWLFYDHHERDPLAYRVLHFTPVGAVTRRWYYFIPKTGEPRGLVHRIESGRLDLLPGSKRLYASWQEQYQGLKELLNGARRVAMQYSPQCAIPYVATVDAGTVELVRSLGVEVVSSADLIQLFEARWTPAMVEMHLEAGKRVDQARRDAFEHLQAALRQGTAVTEYSLRQFLLDRFSQAGLETDFGPIVAVNANASDCHYVPTAQRHSPIRRGDLVLVDLWAKLREPDAVYYDITWTAYCGPEPPELIRQVFAIVREARDTALRLITDSLAAGRTLRGCDVDDAVRGYITAQGYGPYFTHRTGHSIGREVHGNGANIDNFETHDERQLIPGTCFSIEPGIYLPNFGIRSEVNVLIEDRGARVTGEIQRELVLLD